MEALASELGEVILIPYVFSMMFLPRALFARSKNARKEDGRRVTY